MVQCNGRNSPRLGCFCDVRVTVFPAVTARHRRRVRRGAARIVAQLPVSGLERASALVAEGCAIVARDADACADVAAAQLVRYATSDLILAL